MVQQVTQGFHHITMISADARRTLRFYRDVLGLGLVKQTVNFDDPGSYHLYFGSADGAPGTLLTFFEWPGSRAGQWGVGGVHHLALGVATAEAQLKWKRWLMSHGVAVSGPLDRGYFRSIYFRDPDGQILEIATAGPGYGVDEPMDALGQRSVVPPGAELRGSRDEAAIATRTYHEPVEAITPDMMLQGIHHISAITDDLARTEEFLDAALGLRVVKRTVNQDHPDTEHWFWASYDGQTVAPHSALTYFGWPGSELRTRPGSGQTHHIAFRAHSDDEQLAWRDHLESLGIGVSPVMERTYFKSIYFNAPDGLLMEIATDGPGFLLDEDAATLGSALKLPYWLETSRRQIESSLAPLA